MSELQWVKNQSIRFESRSEGGHDIFVFFWWKIILEEMLKPEKPVRGKQAAGRLWIAALDDLAKLVVVGALLADEEASALSQPRSERCSWLSVTDRIQIHLV